MTYRLSLLLVLVLLACGGDEREPELGPLESSLVVRAADGVVHGISTGGVRGFFAIPYAQPPVGELRFRSPRPAKAWSGERDATAYGPQCMQALPLSPSSEDCLTVNVWAPEPAPEKLRPTMVWLHGGAFVVGNNALYDGAPLAQRGDVVVVAVNYRLGALGFLAHSSLTKDPGGRGSSGNYGLEDQLLALQWVRDNVRAFGGDPDNVTLFGESAGSACTCALLGTHKARGLVHHAIMESGACIGFESSLADAELRGDKTVASLGCSGDTLDCLRNMDAGELTTKSTDALDALLRQRWRPIVDGVVVPDVPNIMPVEVPIIIGTNRNEGGQFGLLSSTRTDFERRVRSYYPNPADAARVLETYSETINGSWGNAFSALVTDSLFVCPTRHLARLAAAAGVDTYMYNFAFGEGFHADEVPYVFGAPMPGDAQLVSDTMLRAWAAFAHTGNPNTGMSPSWPRYDASTDQHFVFDVVPSLGSGLKRATCDVLDTLPALHFD